MSDEPEIYIDPYAGRVVPCVMCGTETQFGGAGTCSEKCADDVHEWIEEVWDD